MSAKGTQKATVTPWEGSAPPTEDAIRDRFAQEELQPYAWSNAPGDRYSVHQHGYHKVLYVVHGSIRFILDPGGPVDLVAGDRLDLPAGIGHSAVVGDNGVLCLEAHQNQG